MKVLVLYDIEKNKVRKLIVDILDEFGLYRIQKSLFIGNVRASLYTKFLRYLEKNIGDSDKC